MFKHAYFKNLSVNFFLIAMMLVYIIIMGALLFLRPRYWGDGYMYNVIPFQTIKGYLFSRHHFNSDIWFKNLFGNIVLFMPIGFFLPMLHTSFRRILKLIFTTILLITAVELTQMLTRVGSFDIDDIILNTFGALLGLVITRIVFRRSKK